jgi:Dolichyl-phosphate-mannose-protein mannosyltransferase
MTSFAASEGLRAGPASGVRRAAPAWKSSRWIALVAVWIASAAYVGNRLDRGWFPLDEGTLGHSAERAVQGELPHRDFDDVYTGGLARFDAVVFEVLGTKLSSLRIAMFAVFLLWVPAVYYVSTRFANPVASAVVTLLCVVWSIPTYPAAMPSWYNLFLATFGIAALIRFTETDKRRWLVAAGVAGGLSVVIKIVGVYYIGAALLFLAFFEHQSAVPAPPADSRRRDRAFALLVTFASVLLVLGLLWSVRAVPGQSKLLQFVLPVALLAITLSLGEWRDPGYDPALVRLRRVAALVAPFAIGVAIPLAFFAAPYAASGSLGALIRGVLIQPIKRLDFTAVPPAPLRTVGAALAWLLVFVPPPRGMDGRHRESRVVIGAYITVLVCVAALAVHGGRPYVAVWLVVCYVVPSVVLAGCILLARRPLPENLRLRQAQLWLLLCMTALCSLVQVPYAGPLYILYFAPIAILAVLATVATQSARLGPRAAIAAGFFLVYGLTAVAPGHVSVWDGRLRAADTWPTVPLDIPRTGLTSSPIFAERYERVVALLHAHSRPGGFTYAAPDCPEVYFLAQLQNPTRTLFDFLDSPGDHDARVLRAIADRHVTALAINTFPMFSPPIDATLATALRDLYPDSAVVDNFVVRWAPAR